MTTNVFDILSLEINPESMQQNHYSTLANTSPISTFIFDIQNKQFIYKNSAFNLLFSKIKGEDISQWEAIIHQDDLDYAKECLKLLLAGKLNEQVQLRICNPDNQITWLRIVCTIQIDEKLQKYIYGQAIDITTDLISQHTYHKYANKKNAILNILAHELAGSLGVSFALSSSLKSEVIAESYIKQISKIRDLNEHALKLIRDLTKREFLETTEVKLTKKRLDIVKKLREYLEEAQKGQEGISKKIDFSSNLSSIYIDLDEPKFMQIFNNLLSNALKFTPINGTISFRAEAKTETVLFSVSDNGIGIPNEFLPLLFDRYTKAGRVGLQQEPSTGLGMSVVKNIIDWHNGKIWVESIENKGTKVYFEIPIHS